MRQHLHTLIRAAADYCAACGWWSKPFCGH
jgi:hypothetical protein